MEIHFLGAAGEVTGSSFLVRSGEVSFLVDCGMFQGGRAARIKNLDALDFDVASLDFVLLTHAHIDHSGLLPRLFMLGYRGPIYATAASADLLRILLLDSAHIQEKEAEWALRNRRQRSSWQVIAAPLYSATQAEEALRHLQPVAYRTPFMPHPQVQVRFFDAGHILGSASIEVSIGGKNLVFSGDIGQPGRPLMRDPEHPAKADFLIVESTYGSRLHRPLAETEDELVAVLEGTLARGNVIIPAFAVGRTQEIIYVLARLVRAGRLSAPLTVYVDSPMATAATEITLRHLGLLNDASREITAWLESNPQLLTINFVTSFAESQALTAIRHGAVIISASGMCDAGRIKYHLQENLPRPECAILITGFQAAGTLGRRLVDGADRVRIFGASVNVRAALHTVGGLSAHADQAALLAWLDGFAAPPAQTFIVHGEYAASTALAQAIRQRLAWPAPEIPAYRSSVRLW